MAAWVIGSLLAFGLLAVAVLLAVQGRHSRDVAGQAITQLAGLRQELASLRQEIEATRASYVTEERKSRQDLKGLLAQAPAAKAAKGAPEGGAPRGGPGVVTGGNPGETGKQDPPRQPDPDPQPKQPDPDPQPKQPDPDPPKDATQAPAKQADPAPKTQDPPMIPFFGQRIAKLKIAFVLDKSSSMKPVFEKLVSEADTAIDSLTEKHEFTILFFDGQTHFFSKKLVPGTQRHKDLAKRFVRYQKAQGATDPLPAIEAAMQYPDLEALVLLTDGAFTDKEFNVLHSFLTNVTTPEKMKGKKRVRLYLIPLTRNPRVDKLMELADKQDF